MTSSAATDAPPPPTLKISAGVDTAEFEQGVADRVSLMMDSNLTSAKLQVNPPALRAESSASVQTASATSRAASGLLDAYA